MPNSSPGLSDSVSQILNCIIWTRCAGWLAIQRCPRILCSSFNILQDKTIDHNQVLLNIWAAPWQNQHNDCAPSEDSDQPGHPPSLIRVFAVCLMGSWGPKRSSCGQRRLWSDLADAQVDLSLRWAHMPFCCFCREAARLLLNISLHDWQSFVISVRLSFCLLFWSSQQWN